MNRYRILKFDFDSRVHLFDPIQDYWEDHVKKMHQQRRRQIINDLKEDYGIKHFKQKFENFIELGEKPSSIVGYHNHFYTQARSAFIHRQYYPALTGVSALGERILNHLVLGLRGFYINSNCYKHIYRKDSFDNWELTINALSDWNILTTSAQENFRELSKLRNKAIHFNRETEISAREDALAALLTFGRIIEEQFSCFKPLPWLFMIPGEVYLKKIGNLILSFN
jgi:hypothetical protein